MSSESITPEEAARAIEYPDKVGSKPDNPFLANFRPYIPAEAHLRELTPLPLESRAALLDLVHTHDHHRPTPPSTANHQPPASATSRDT